MSGISTIEFQTERQLAHAVGVSVFTVRRWRKKLGLQAIKLGREWRVRRDWFEGWVEQRVSSASAATQPFARAIPKDRVPVAVRVGRAPRHRDMGRALDLLAIPAKKSDVKLSGRFSQQAGAQ